ncbi:MAG TPA: DUF6064 family protein [Thermoanaerobaculia bacterium]
MPFTAEQFFAVFRAYNEAVWPAQWFLTAAGVLALAGALSRRAAGARAAYVLLAALWLWMALAYHFAHFAAINPAAPLFGALFAVAAGLFLWQGLRSPAPRLELHASGRGLAGLAFALFGLAVYPLLNPLLGHHFPAALGFGLPCPTTLFTLGILSLARPRAERALLAVPVVWALVGSLAAFTLGVAQDFILIPAAAWGLFLAFAPRSRGRLGVPALRRQT